MNIVCILHYILDGIQKFSALMLFDIHFKSGHLFFFISS
jgi:hypothetical protein